MTITECPSVAAGITAGYRWIRDGITGYEHWSGSQGPAQAAWLKPKLIP